MLTAAFAALGFVIGNITSLSSSPVAMALVPTLFSLIGGSFVVFLSKISAVDRKIAAHALFSFSVACLAGVYLGAVINSYSLLGPKPILNNEKATQATYTYLRSIDVTAVNSIDKKKRAGHITADDAYEALLELVVEQK